MHREGSRGSLHPGVEAEAVGSWSGLPTWGAQVGGKEDPDNMGVWRLRKTHSNELTTGLKTHE